MEVIIAINLIDLVAAFKATLQETRQATLLLHVIDAADVRVQENIEAVNTVLEEIDPASNLPLCTVGCAIAGRKLTV